MAWEKRPSWVWKLLGATSPAVEPDRTAGSGASRSKRRVASEHLWAGGERQMDETRDLSVQELLAAEMILNVELNNASLPTVPCLSRERPNRRVLCII